MMERKPAVLFVSLVIAAAIIALLYFGFNRLTNRDVELELAQDASEEVGDDIDSMIAILKTNHGDITLDLLEDMAPKTVENFVSLAKGGFYDGTRFHRVIAGFMIQGGDPLTKDLEAKAEWGRGGPGYFIEDELNEARHVKGALSMAHAGPNTGGSQFFIVTASSTPHLDGVHTVFGNVIEGIEVVEKIESLPTGLGDIPEEDALIESVEIVEG